MPHSELIFFLFFIFPSNRFRGQLSFKHFLKAQTVWQHSSAVLWRINNHPLIPLHLAVNKIWQKSRSLTVTWASKIIAHFKTLCVSLKFYSPSCGPMVYSAKHHREVKSWANNLSWAYSYSYLCITYFQLVDIDGSSPYILLYSSNFSGQ